MKKISVILVEDHQLVREMWASLFADHDEIEIAGESGVLDDAIEMIKTKKPDIVLRDINLSQGFGMDAVPLILKFAPASGIIAVSMHNLSGLCQKDAADGSPRLCHQNSPPQEMLRAIEEIMNGKIYICSEMEKSFSGQMLKDNSVL